MGKQSLKLVIASGGTGGHISPVIAVLNTLRERCAVDATWIGSTWGIEHEAAARAGVPFVAIQSGKLRRYLSWQTPVDAVRIPLGYAQAYQHLKRIHPAVVFSTGGYVAVPTALAAARLGIPVLTHEQTAQLGLATRIIARSADVLAVSFPLPEAKEYRGKARVIVTGNPVRSSVFGGDAARGAAHFGLSATMRTIYVTGGARGSSPINERIERALPLLLPSMQVIHATGPTAANGDYPRLRAIRESLTDEWRARYVVVETLGDELRDVYALAALVVGRSGAGTVAELAALGKPSILIPLPGTGGDEATKNARVLADAQAALLLPQSEATPELLASHVIALLNDGARRARMSDAARSLAPSNAAEKIADALLELARRSRGNAYG
ncbi:MAG: undecaprenyldiphospho-muramoylpentapeptide beta-N-acetylglucosaminyltransferase [Chloroflexota bacterium]|nr:undecaprenyldiphospho-muramoylpentapeptide beta-N-acetylglucosaminyltransferase [Chloroflexota bacterium]